MKKIYKKINTWLEKHLDKLWSKIEGYVGNIDISDSIEDEHPIETVNEDNQPQDQPVEPTQPQQPQQPQSNPDTQTDAVKYSDLEFCWGNFKKANAYIASLISNLSVNSNGMSYKWKSGGCEKLGAGSSTDASATLACLFCKIGGKWKGGKFDWISTSRTTRDFKNIKDGYNGWSKTAIQDASEYAFCIVSAKNNTRTNVIKCGKSFKSQSTTSDIIGIVKSILSFIIGKSEKSAEKKDKIMAEIEEEKMKLRHALADGRITDAGAIQGRIEKLMNKFNKIGLFSSLAVCLIFSGCKSTKISQEYNKPMVLGERVIICQPEDVIEVPKLIEPAKKWYLVDDVGLTQWLGIPQSEQP